MGQHRCNSRSANSIKLLQILFILVATSLFNIANATEQLTAKQLENWIASQADLSAWGKEHEEHIAKYEDQAFDSQNPMDITVESMIKPLKASGLYDSATTIIKQHQFPSLEAWAATTLKITKTAAAIEMEGQSAAFDLNGLEALKNAPDIPDEQRAMLEQVIQQNMAIIKSLKEGVSEQDKAVVRPFLERITKLMEE